jgi:glutaredoxin 3
MGRVTVFSLAACPHCQRAKAVLTKRGVPFTDVSLTDYPEKRADMLQLADRLTVPQVFFNDTHVGGASDLDALIAAHDRGGGGGGGGEGGRGAPPSAIRTSFDDVIEEVLAAPDPVDARLARPTYAPKPAPAPSERTHPVVVTVGGARALTALDAVRELTAALDIRDRAHNLTVYTRCFVGSHAVDALMRHFGGGGGAPDADADGGVGGVGGGGGGGGVGDRAAAIAFGQALLDAGVMHHVTKGHARFKDEHLFYRLQAHAEPGVLNAFRAEWSDRVDDPLTTVKHLQKTFGELQTAHTAAASGLVDYAALRADPKFALDFREAVCEFRAVDLGAMHNATRLAFLINLYNLMILTAMAQLGGALHVGIKLTHDP